MNLRNPPIYRWEDVKDTQCNYVGGFVVAGLVKAIACFSDHILIISLKTPIHSSDASIAKTLILDLKQLDLDLVF